MISPALAHLLLSLIVGISVRADANPPPQYSRSVLDWLAASSLLLVFRLVPLQLAVEPSRRHWMSVLFLVGMMLLSEPRT